MHEKNITDPIIKNGNKPITENTDESQELQQDGVERLKTSDTANSTYYEGCIPKEWEKFF